MQLLEKYFEGKLSDEEREIFESKMKNDPAFAKEVEQEKDLRIALDLMARIRNKEIVRTIAQKSKPVKRRIRTYRIAASLAILISFGIGYAALDASFSDKALANRFFEKYDKAVTTKSSNTVENQLDDAIKLYQSSDYSGAYGAFTALPDTLSTHWIVQLYIGNCELELGQEEKATTTFSEIIRESEQYQETARWYLAIAFLKLNDENNARRILNQIEEGQYNYSNAQKLLNKLDSPIRRLPGI